MKPLVSLLLRSELKVIWSSITFDHFYGYLYLIPELGMREVYLGLAPKRLSNLHNIVI